MVVQISARTIATGLVSADERLTNAAAELKGTRFSSAVTFIGKLGDQPELRILSTLTLAAGLIASQPRLAKAGARMLLAHEAATLAKDLAKNLVDRTRPRSARRSGDSAPRPGDSKAKEESSFPSGHSAGAMAVANAFSREFPELRGLATGAAVLIAVAQVPRASHYPSDILAGMALGATMEALVNGFWSLAAGQKRSAAAAAPAAPESSATPA